MNSLKRFDQDGIEILIDQTTGESFCSVSGYARMSGVPYVFAKDFSKNLYLPSGECVEVLDEENIAKVTCKYAVEHNSTVAAMFFRKMWTTGWGAKDKPAIGEENLKMVYSFYDAFFPLKNKQKQKAEKQRQRRKRLKTSPEYAVKTRLQAKYGGKVEVVTPFGRIDLLTADKIFEVKEASAWKSAIGQLLAYSKSYPKHQKILYLFGNTAFLDLPTIKHLLSELDISLEIDCD